VNFRNSKIRLGKRSTYTTCTLSNLIGWIHDAIVIHLMVAVDARVAGAPGLLQLQ